MKKSLLLCVVMMLFASVTVLAQDDDVDVPSMDELLERPGNSGIAEVDKFKNASFDLYDKVVETRRKGEEDGWTGEQARAIVTYGKEVLEVLKASVDLGKNIKSLKPKTKLPKAIKVFATSKKALTQTRGHLKYMKSQFTEEELAAFEMELETEGGEEEEGE